MHINAPESCNFMFLFCFLIKSGLTLKNDATEIFYSHVVSPVEDTQSNASLNRARTGGRGFTAHERGEFTRLNITLAFSGFNKIILQLFFLRNGVYRDHSDVSFRINICNKPVLLTLL